MQNPTQERKQFSEVSLLLDTCMLYVCIFLFEFASTHELQAQLHGSECDNEVN